MSHLSEKGAWQEGAHAGSPQFTAPSLSRVTKSRLGVAATAVTGALTVSHELVNTVVKTVSHELVNMRVNVLVLRRHVGVRVCPKLCLCVCKVLVRWCVRECSVRISSVHMLALWCVGVYPKLLYPKLVEINLRQRLNEPRGDPGPASMLHHELQEASLRKRLELEVWPRLRSAERLVVHSDALHRQSVDPHATTNAPPKTKPNVTISRAQDIQVDEACCPLVAQQ